MTRLFLACVATVGVSCGLDEQQVHYANVEAARTEGAFSRGWLPDVLPSDAVDIWERHNLDTNETWACSKTPSGVAQVRSKLDALRARRVDWPATHSPGTQVVARRNDVANDRGAHILRGSWLGGHRRNAPDGTAACLLRKHAS
jgi:hypothetical protein